MTMSPDAVSHSPSSAPFEMRKRVVPGRTGTRESATPGTGAKWALMDLDAVADELYGLPLDEFVPTRKAREEQAKGAHNKGLAAQIHRLAKPNLVAWLVNQLVREHNGDIQTLLALGSAMREATVALSGDRLRDLSRQQHEVIRGLVHQAEQLATAGGRQVSTDATRSLDETLYATVADPGAADAVAAGRLTAGLRSTGLASLETTGNNQRRPSATSPPPKAKAQPRTNQHQGVEQRERAEATVAQAKSVVEAATQARDDAQAALQQAEQSEAHASDRMERLRRELHEAVETQSKTKTDRRNAQSAFDRAARGVEDAQRRLTDATAERERPARE